MCTENGVDMTTRTMMLDKIREEEDVDWDDNFFIDDTHDSECFTSSKFCCLDDVVFDLTIQYSDEILHHVRWRRPRCRWTCARRQGRPLSRYSLDSANRRKISNWRKMMKYCIMNTWSATINLYSSFFFWKFQIAKEKLCVKTVSYLVSREYKVSHEGWLWTVWVTSKFLGKSTWTSKMYTFKNIFN